MRSHSFFVAWKKKRTKNTELHTPTGNSVIFHKTQNIKLFSPFQGKYKDINIEICWIPSVIYIRNTYKSFIKVADIIWTQGKSIISK